MKLIHGAVAIDDVKVFVPKTHPSYRYWLEWCNDSFMTILTDMDEVRKMNGDYLFLVSCTEIVGDDVFSRYRHCIVIHESPLPHGRGWSPLAWQILEGKNEITVSAIKCAYPVDSGDIIKQAPLILDGTELSQEIHEKAFAVKSALAMSIVLDQTLDRKDADILPQSGAPSYYRRRKPEDSELFMHKTIAEQFDLLRICEPRFPAFINHRGCKYTVTLQKVANGGE